MSLLQYHFSSVFMICCIVLHILAAQRYLEIFNICFAKLYTSEKSFIQSLGRKIKCSTHGKLKLYHETDPASERTEPVSDAYQIKNSKRNLIMNLI